MARLPSTMSVPVSVATKTVTMTIKVSGVRRFAIRSNLALLIIKFATLVSPIVTRIDIASADPVDLYDGSERNLRDVLG
jgi:hypothetical protein